MSRTQLRPRNLKLKAQALELRAESRELPGEPGTGSIRVSVVVPTYRRPELLRRCLKALLAQDLDQAAYEIIVADDAACSDTQRLVEELAAEGQPHGRRPVLHYLPVAGSHGPAAARNTGWRAARGAIIAFTDDDCIPRPDWLRRGLAVFGDGIAGASGRVVVPLPPEPTDYERDAAGLQRSEFVTANCFYRRQALEACGGFDERFTAAWREDSDLFFQLLSCAGKTGALVEAPEAVVIHPVRPAPWGVSLQQQRKSMYNALLYKKHPQLYRWKIQPGPPWRYYAICAALLVAVAGALAASWAPALAGLAAWLALTSHFCLLRLRGTAHTPRHVLEMLVTSLLIPPLSIFWRLRGALKYRVIFF